MNTEFKLSYNLGTTPHVCFGAGKLNLLHSLQLPGTKPLVVISSGKSVHTNGTLARVLQELQLAGCEPAIVFDKVQANPIKETVELGGQVAREAGCDFVVAVGGGSVLDTAKVLAMSATNPGDLWNFAMSGTGKRMKAANAPLPWIAIVTTAGTGSEVDAGGVITNLKTKEKLGIFSDFARYAIVDPELMLTVPKRFTAYQGFDALCQLMEGYICKSANLYSRMLQETAIPKIVKYLPQAIADGQNLEARSQMAFAATMSGYSMVASTCTAEHSIEHALSAYHEQLPHGAGLIIISHAYYAAIIRQHVADDRFITLARMLGSESAQKAEDFLTALDNFQQKCGVNGLKMSDYGINPDEFDDMATNAMTVMDRLATQDIQPLTHDEIVRILQESWN